MENLHPNALLMKCIPLVSQDPGTAASYLQRLQPLLRNNTLYSENETLEDVPTNSIMLLAADYYLAMALINAPQDNKSRSSNASRCRKEILERSHAMLHAFLRRMELLGVFEVEIPNSADGSMLLKAYHHLLEMEDYSHSEEPEDHLRRKQHLMTAGEMRNAKIRNYKLKRSAEKAVEDLSKRISEIEDDDDDRLDDYTRRSSVLVLLQNIVQAMDQLAAGYKEIEMLSMAVMFERNREEIERHQGTSHPDKKDVYAVSSSSERRQLSDVKINKPMEVTRVTQDPLSGKLIFNREHLQSQVFKPSWNQPTMSLEELAEIERTQAIERGEKQKQLEADEKLKARRYEFLVRDGLEDDVDLVDASAKVDQAWDDFKDENPRGSGNKMGERGDRNF